MKIDLHQFEHNTCIDFLNHSFVVNWLLDGVNEDLLKFCKQKRHGLRVKVETRSKEFDHDSCPILWVNVWNISRFGKILSLICTSAKYFVFAVTRTFLSNPIPLIQSNSRQQEGSQSVVSSPVSTIVSWGVL